MFVKRNNVMKRQSHRNKNLNKETNSHVTGSDRHSGHRRTNGNEKKSSPPVGENVRAVEDGRTTSGTCAGM